MTTSRFFVCSLCQRPTTGWGNNPHPLIDSHDQCCDMCNENVINYRIVLCQRGIDRADKVPNDVAEMRKHLKLRCRLHNPKLYEGAKRKMIKQAARIAAENDIKETWR